MRSTAFQPYSKTSLPLAVNSSPAHSVVSLEGCLEFLAQDELLEVTPENLRIRKQILNHEQRMKAKSRMK